MQSWHLLFAVDDESRDMMLKRVEALNWRLSVRRIRLDMMAMHLVI